jgi:hypothetical protein
VGPAPLSFLSKFSIETNYGKIFGLRAFHPLTIFPSTFLQTKQCVIVEIVMVIFFLRQGLMGFGVRCFDWNQNRRKK